jgi:hypothetical protein
MINWFFLEKFEDYAITDKYLYGSEYLILNYKEICSFIFMGTGINHLFINYLRCDYK